jgi:hypothetical protein
MDFVAFSIDVLAMQGNNDSLEMLQLIHRTFYEIDKVNETSFCLQTIDPKNMYDSWFFCDSQQKV